ncbi:hypothetical protein COCMIDRAFT_96106 [Bipolaris oryzae ATCC 44560]|uniref:AA1-like domain-containing protein n=1 Tax=Bipolaris oryzae ATCC 44560 TaxID=930090 RepID=W6Z0G3_COCMI|nr:uncharacterized protein COCMIDRAFT_96106 [Bipolaris oryzae ATCC 44560]EUC45247.1 hypothetical protein COCMIDRAFT_96106 [Bipolaris oryzae ATCC 44560]
MFSVKSQTFVALLLASVVSADYNLTCLDIFWSAAPTVTLVSSNSIATTYSFQCDAITTPTPTPTPTSTFYTGPPPQSWTYDPNYTELPANTPTRAINCFPFIMFQGPETYGVRLTDTEGGYITLDGDCSWTGVFTDVPITCDGQVTGSGYTSGFSSGTPTVFAQSDLRSLTWGGGFGYAVATVVEKTGAASTPSEGGGGRVAFPVGVVVMAGGAFVVGAVAWAL